MTYRCNHLQRLESRVLLFAAADYYPLIPGETWEYSGTVVDAPATMSETVAADTLSGVPVMRVDSTITTAGHVQKTSDYYTTGKNGIFLHRTTGDDVSFTFDKPIQFLAGEFNLHHVVNIPPTGASIHIVAENVGTFDGTGTVRGETFVVDSLSFKLPGGGRVFAIKVTSDLRFEFEGTMNGKPAAFAARQGTSTWLGYRMGTLKSVDELTGVLVLDGQPRNSFVAANFDIAASSLLPTDDERPVIKDGVLVVPGTGADDEIEVRGSGTINVEINNVVYGFNQGVMPINVFAGDGNDRITFDVAQRGLYVDAGPGNDSVSSLGFWPDTITGGAGKDTLEGGAGDDRVAGNGGHDLIRGADGNDRLYGGNENDTLEGGNGVDRAWGGAGDDLISGGGSNDKLFGEDGLDILSGGNQDDRLDGGAGKDQILGGPGNDFLTAGGGNDYLFPADGLDTAYGDAGADIFELLDTQIDTAYGGSDDDSILNSDAADVLDGI